MRHTTTLILLTLTLAFSKADDTSAVSENKSRFTGSPFPKGFLFGTATAAYQIEGAWNVSDKGVSIWDTFVHNSPSPISDGSTGDVACNSYEFYKRDIKMLQYLGVNFYKFSISWPRVLPKGTPDVISDDGVAYYNNLIDTLIAANIKPYLVIYKWDLPQALEDLGGWRNKSSADWLEAYANVLFEKFGDRVQHWTTMVGLNNVAVNGYGTGTLAPGVKNPGVADYEVAKNLILAHARVWHLYDEKYRNTQNGVVGVQLMTNYAQGATDSEDDIKAATDAFDFEVGIYANPIFSEEGGLPKTVIDIVSKKSKSQGLKKSRLTQFTEKQIKYIKGTSDFYGIDYVFAKNWTHKGYSSGETYAVPSVADDIGAVSTNDLEIDGDRRPEGIKKVLAAIKNKYNNPPILITYNSNSDADDPKDKLIYYKKYLKAIIDVIRTEKVNVVGYVAWSLMDGFEWSKGYEEKNGLFEVDFKSEEKTRKPKITAVWYKNLVKTKKLDLSYEPVEDKTTF